MEQGKMNHEALSKILRQIADATDDAQCDLVNAAVELDELGIEEDDELKQLRMKLSLAIELLDSLYEKTDNFSEATKRRVETLANLRAGFVKQLADARLQEPDSQHHLLDFDKFRLEHAEAMGEQSDDESQYCGAW
jgi:hypothetical protein